MLSSLISATNLFQIIASPTNENDRKLRSINELKTHVKKDFVDINQVPKYLEALSIAVDIPDAVIQSNSFSVLSHLVKRVSMQDTTGSVLKSQSYLVLPIIINKLGDTTSNSRSSAKRALEAYWLSAPKQVEESIIDIALSHKNPKVNEESIIWLDHIITNINPHFKLDAFLPHIVKLLAIHNDRGSQELVTAITTLFKNYYSMKHNRLYKFDLSKEFELQGIPSSIRDLVTNSIGSNSIDTLKQSHTSKDLNIENKFVLAGNTRVTVNQNDNDNIGHNTHTPHTSTFKMSRPKSRTNFHNFTKASLPSEESKPTLNMHDISSKPYTASKTLPSKTKEIKNESQEVNINPELERVVSKSLTYKIDDSLPLLDVQNCDEIYNLITIITPAFEGKETEFNWSEREKNIIKLRSIIRGNAPVLYLNDLTICLKELSDSICKGVSSLRTTLSSHGCHLIKECAIVLNGNIESLTDAFIPTLLKLCSATKHIASTNANMSLSAIFINVPYTSKLLPRILVSANEKNVQPRSYSGLWLQIILVRFHNSSGFHSHHHGPNGLSGIEMSTRVLVKILADPNPNVRQVAKETYWCFNNYFPSDAESLLTKLETNVVRAIERSKPKNIATNIQPSNLSTTTKTSRPSIKESIMARNKELRQKQKDQSRPSSRVTSAASPNPFDDNAQRLEKGITNDQGKIGRLGMAKRNTYSSSISKQDSSSLAERNESIYRKFSDTISLTKKRNIAKADDLDEEMKHDIAGSQNTHTSHRPSLNSSAEISLFDKQNDPILKFLSSDQKELISEGISLLKYAIMGEEDLSSEVNGLLKNISIRNPDMLKPLFLSTDNLFKKTYQFFEMDDFFRVCSILIEPITEKTVDMIISIAQSGDIYESSIKLISYSTSLGSIDDSDLTMQVIRYKSIIVRLIINFLKIGLDKIPISDSCFLKLVTHIFELVNLLKSTGLYKSFSELLVKLHSMNPTLFISELGMATTSTKEEVEFVVGIDGILDLSNLQNSQFASWDELTRVVPGHNLGNMSPLKGPSDLTMIVPVDKEANNNLYTNLNRSHGNYSQCDETKSETNLETRESDFPTEKPYDGEHESEIPKPNDNEIHHINDDPMEVDYNNDLDKDMTTSENLEEKQNERLIDNLDKDKDSTSSLPEDDDNIFVDVNSEVNTQKPELFNKFGQTDKSSELVANFAQVKITELSKQNLSNKSPIQTFIDKVDPLNKISTRNKPISIYEDENNKGSPQKVRNYNYTELNWFNFQLAKFTGNRHNLDDPDHYIENYETLCNELSTSSIEGPQFITILNYLQDKSNSDFSKYYYSKGHSLLESSLWIFFENCSYISLSKKLSGLIILKQILINRTILDLNKLWCLLANLGSEVKTSTDELAHAVSETFEEMLSGLYSSNSIFATILKTLESTSSEENSSFRLSFILESLSKLLSMNSISLLVDDSLILRIDNILSNYMNSHDVEIRRCVILSYGKLLKATRISNSIELNEDNASEKSVMEGIMERLSMPQKKLIEYYSQA